MKGRCLKFLMALCAGGMLVGVAALLVLVSDLEDFYQTCFWLGVVTLGLAVAALYSLVQAPSRAPRRAGEPHVRESSSAPVVAVSDTERRNVGWASVYLLLAAVPCLLTSAAHFLA